jgi:hypothetical protein
MAQDVQPVEGKAIEIRPYERFVKNLQTRAAESDRNRSFDVAASQMDKILTAETEEEFWDADEGGTVSGKDFTDIAIQINGYEIARSDDKYESDLGVYVNINATLLQNAKGYKTGEQVIINTGASLVVTKLEAARARDMFPIKCFIKGTEAKNGTVLKLRPVASLPASA